MSNQGPSLNPTTRFSDRADAYVRYRPTYPAELIHLLQSECNLTELSQVADIGSGPGNLTLLLLPVAGTVTGVEPNQAMREAGETLMASHPNFVSVDGTAETTGLRDNSVDLIVAAQAFHWFRQTEARAEFRRILKPGGFVALIWNDRQTSSTPFLSEYERMLNEFSEEYARVNHRQIPEEDLERFLGETMQVRHFFNEQVFDWEGLKGRVLSSSYVPTEGDRHDHLMRQLRAAFDKFQEDGHVSFLYDTLVFYAQWN